MSSPSMYGEHSAAVIRTWWDNYHVWMRLIQERRILHRIALRLTGRAGILRKIVELMIKQT